jgi:hypothetical protein
LQSVPITTNVVSLIPHSDKVYSIQPYVIKFVSDFRQVGGFLREFRFPFGLGLWCLMPLSTIFQSVLLVEETGIPGENHRPAESH